MSANPLDCLASNEGIWTKILALITKWHPNAFIVGIPLNMDGSAQHVTVKAREFAKNLQTKFDLPVYEVDERLTTVEARQMLYDLGGYKALQKISVDSFAAKLILEAWLRGGGKHEE